MRNVKTKHIEGAKNAHDYQLLIKSLLQNSVYAQPENEIIYRDKFRMNYKEFNKRVRRLANLLSTIGLEGAATVGVIDYDSHRYLECYFAIPMTGNVLHTVNWRLSPQQILFTINHAEDDVLIVHADFIPLIESYKDQLKTVKTIIYIDDEGLGVDSTLDFAGEYEALIAKEKDSYDFPDFDEKAIASLFYTSGTTGDPKAVFFSHRQIVMHTFVIMTTFGGNNAAYRVTGEDVYLPMTPMFHVHAWGVPFAATILGLKQVYMGKFDPATLLSLFIKEKPTMSHSVPTILNMILTHPAAASLDLSGWKILIGGSALPKPLARLALSRGISVVTGYGMSETCPIITVAQISDKELNKDIDWQVENRTKTGRPVMLVEIKLWDEDGNEVPRDGETKGEIVVRAPHLTNGYFKDSERGEELWEGGYLHTGDIGVQDENYDIVIVDRAKDVIKTGGEWISSIDLEGMIMYHETVLEAAVIGVPHEKWGERPYAIVVLKPDAKTSAEDIKAHLNVYVEKQVINNWAIPDVIDFVDEIPKTSVGKINKKLIRSQHQERMNS